jgi:hypothetical protein
MRRRHIAGVIAVGAAGAAYLLLAWAFLQEQPDVTTRLLVRERYAYTQWWSRLLVEPVEAVSFVMSQKMLRGIRDRAEGTTVPRRVPDIGVCRSSPAAHAG